MISISISPVHQQWIYQVLYTVDHFFSCLIPGYFFFFLTLDINLKTSRICVVFNGFKWQNLILFHSLKWQSLILAVTVFHIWRSRSLTMKKDHRPFSLICSSPRARIKTLESTSNRIKSVFQREGLLVFISGQSSS